MNIIHDNSTFLAIGRCLSKRSNDRINEPNDLENLLHFFTTYALSEKIIVQGFVHPKVSRQREASLNLIKDTGLDLELLEIVVETEEEFKDRCLESSNIILEKFSQYPNKMFDKILFGSENQMKISHYERSHAEDIHSIIVSKNRASIRKEIMNSDFHGHGYGAVGYILSANEELYELTQQKRDSWSIITTQKLINTLR